MSTFNGVVREFPRIRIDFFRTNISQPPPLACFLSHVHSDHLQGLESLKSPFVYCSPATRRLLLRMEKYHHRMNFAEGILEVRKQTYRHLQLILKAIPLQTPTEIELGMNERIRVTLLDANHCPGSVMFLVEGDSKAILYTGDVRAELWWVNSIIRNPVLIPFTLCAKRLDCLYLDTTFAAKEEIYRDFPSKATGLQELLQKANDYAPETIFYFRAWTLGYEDVWVALSAGLGSRVHVDEYQLRLYRSLSEDSRDGFTVLDAPALNGFQAGNHIQPGCLTTDSSGLRLHSCEPGTACHATLTKSKNVVWITPIITRSRDGENVYEFGARGGGDGLCQTTDIDITDSVSWEGLADLCIRWIKDPGELSNALQRIMFAQASRNSTLSLSDLGLVSDEGISLKDLVNCIASAGKEAGGGPEVEVLDGRNSSAAIKFPYSRHSSYNELRGLVSAFKPRDICPCTVDEETWSEEVSMQALFGDLCSESRFDHDRRLRMRLQDANDRHVIPGSKKRKREGLRESQEAESAHDVSKTAKGPFGMQSTAVERSSTVNRRYNSEDTVHITNEADEDVKAEMTTDDVVDNEDSHTNMSARVHSDQSTPGQTVPPPPVNNVQTPPRILGNTGGSSFINLTGDGEPCSPPNSRLPATHTASEAMAHSSDMSPVRYPRPSDEMSVNQEKNGSPKEDSENRATPDGFQDTIQEVTEKPQSQVSLTTSAFESQGRPDDSQNRELSGLQLDRASADCIKRLQHNSGFRDPSDAASQNGAGRENTTKTTPSSVAEKLTRTDAIKEAYWAARQCLRDGADVGSWEDLNLRSVGRKGHVEEEIEL